DERQHGRHQTCELHHQTAGVPAHRRHQNRPGSLRSVCGGRHAALWKGRQYRGNHLQELLHRLRDGAFVEEEPRAGGPR
ncbi:Immunoglobulin superfamily member 3, partial [Larimichthys crocea]